ncbi:MAG: PTS lactose/cellobiose transporter subunit IIA [Longicatena sp.]
MENLELVCFQIISAVGSARSSYVEAISIAKTGNFEEAINKIKEGDKEFLEGHRAHATLIQQEANDNPVHVNLLLVHAEDQLMSAETTKLIAEEIIELYKKQA